MKHQLQRKSKYYSINLYDWRVTDYTGRWKIENVNGIIHLYIECFYIEEVITYTTEEVSIKWWSRKKKEVKIPTGTKPHAVVSWVHEDDLRIISEHINTCESCND